MEEFGDFLSVTLSVISNDAFWEMRLFERVGGAVLFLV